MSINIPQIVFEADAWRKGMIMSVYGETRLPHLPIDVDHLSVQSCAIDTLNLNGLLDSCLDQLVVSTSRIRRIVNIPPCLKHLIIQNSRIAELPDIPPTLETLILNDVRELDTETMPPLPSSLRVLRINNTNIGLSESLPPQLEQLDCVSMGLTHLPSALPESLLELNCSKNRLSALPASLPPHLVYLKCSDNQMDSLPPLVSGLRILDCSNNKLRTLPMLPSSLRTLNFSNNPIEMYPHIGSHVFVKISRTGEFFKALGESKYVLNNGMTVFPPSIESVNFIRDDLYATMMFEENEYDEHDILDCVLEVQRQVAGRGCLKAIKEELMAATWHPRRVEGWCGVDFSELDCD
jgi:Leucine-rich repeat (LRR) protein